MVKSQIWQVALVVDNNWVHCTVLCDKVECLCAKFKRKFLFLLWHYKLWTPYLETVFISRGLVQSNKEADLGPCCGERVNVHMEENQTSSFHIKNAKSDAVLTRTKPLKLNWCLFSWLCSLQRWHINIFMYISFWCLVFINHQVFAIWLYTVV